MNLTQSTEILLTNFIQLPENLQKEIIDFSHFLISKYNTDNFQNNIAKIELTENQKEILNKRYKAFKSNPNRRIHWNVAKAELFSKYGI